MQDKCVKEYTVDAGSAPCRLDAYVSRNYPCSRKQARIACESEQILVDGKKQAPGFILKAGCKISIVSLIEAPRARPELVSKEEHALFQARIIYEDRYLLAVNKLREQSSVTLAIDDPLTLADCIAEYSAECRLASSDARESGLVQRLDYYTSGAIIAAKSTECWEELHNMLVTGAVTKTYYALVEGAIDRGGFSVSAPLEPINGGRKMKVSANNEHLSPGDTKVELVQVWPETTFGTVSLVKACSRKTQRHQIRAHLATSGHPLCGDKLYGASQDFYQFPKTTVKSSGFLLHAATITLEHPVTGMELEILAGHDSIDEFCHNK